MENNSEVESPEEAGQPGKHGATRVYEADGVSVSWDASRCLHVAACIRAAPEVFDPRRRPWVDLSAAAPDAVRQAVHACPTGALRLPGEDPAGSVDRATVVVRPDGPLYVRGDMTVVGAEGTVLDRGTRAALCRCGATGNPPWCDSSHKAVGFVSGPAQAHEATVGETPACGTVGVKVTAGGPYRVQGAVVEDRDGTVLDDSGACSLCRCGRSSSKPFCDGSHREGRPPPAV